MGARATRRPLVLQIIRQPPANPRGQATQPREVEDQHVAARAALEGGAEEEAREEGPAPRGPVEDEEGGAEAGEQPELRVEREGDGEGGGDDEGVPPRAAALVEEGAGVEEVEKRDLDCCFVMVRSD